VAVSCPLCEALELGRERFGNDLAAALPDRFPLSPGHHLVVPRRHEGDYFRLALQEVQACWDLIPLVKATIDAGWAPDGYNLGVNVGTAGGQTIDHVHVHVIPRYLGDRADPRGGVRWVLPDRAAYWQDPSDLS
jgi:diadenosine tetraphosphate (Ap4A) HIT family hydrolase